MTIDFLQGDVREVLKTLPNDHFDCVVTSPPYFQLRNYGMKGQIGQENSLKEYIETMVGVCQEIRRVMKPTGCFWLNVGDFYASGKCGRDDGYQTNYYTAKPKSEIILDESFKPKPRKPTDGLKHKDLCMVPNRLAIALQDAGWYIRSEIIWHKPSCMPESVTD